MSDPKRLLEGDPSALERAVLRAGVADGPSDAARARVARALGFALPSGSDTDTDTIAVKKGRTEQAGDG